MPALHQLLSFHIIENDKNDQVLMTWTYPNISESTKLYIVNKLPQIKKLNSVYVRYKKDWIYMNNVDVFESDNLPDIKQFSLVIIAKDFNPSKYEAFGKILSECYRKTGNPVELVRPYLSVYTTGTCSTLENGTFVMRAFENKNCSIKIKDFITMFGLEIILIYTAMLLKKRIVLYHHTLHILLKCLESMTALMSRRNPNDYLYPLIEINQADILELKSKNWFVAGLTDSAVCSKTDVFDLLVNLPALEITIMPHAKESLAMTKTHKDIAMSMVQMAENPDLFDGDVVTEIDRKTQELLNHLRSFSSITTDDTQMITVNDLKSKNLHPSLENFLFNLAVAENLMMF